MFDLCEATEDNPFIHGMSKPFVKALQELFDVMDTDNSGTIKYIDLASQWHEDMGDPFFPKGLIACLAKVTLPNGLLTFDRFCAGIKLCLLKNQVEINEDALKASGFCAIGSLDHSFSGPSLSDQGRPPSEPQIFAPPPPSSLSNQHQVSSEINDVYCHSNKNTMDSASSFATSTDDLSSKPKKLPLPSYEQVMAAKSKSLSKLSIDRSTSEEQPEQINSTNSTSNQQSRLSTCQPKPPRLVDERPKLYENYANMINELSMRQSMSDRNNQRAKSMSHLEALSTSHWSQMANGTSQENKPVSPGESKSPKRPTAEGSQSMSLHNSPSSNGRSASQPKTVSRNSIMKTLQTWRDNILHKQASDCEETRIGGTGFIVTNGATSSDLMSTASNSLRRSVPKRREPRRHTVGANGIDLYTIKRFQQMEHEKEILIRGLNEIEKTKEWFIRQVSSLQDKINFAGRCGSFPTDCNIDAYQERVNFQATRIQTVNQHLVALREAAHTFPIHMNLAIRPLNGLVKMDPNQPKQLVVNPNLVNKLKEQNRLLTEEVTRKCERITQLEREKSSLIRELFQARTYSSYYNGNFDDTMM